MAPHKSDYDQSDYKNFREYAYNYKKEDAQYHISRQNFQLNSRIESIKGRDFEVIPKLRKGPFNQSTITKNGESVVTFYKDLPNPVKYTGFSKFEQDRIDKENERLHKRITNVKSNLSARDYKNPISFKRSKSDDLDSTIERNQAFENPEISMQHLEKLKYESSTSSVIKTNRNNSSSIKQKRIKKKQKNFVRKVNFPPVMRQRLHEYLVEKRNTEKKTECKVDFNRPTAFNANGSIMEDSKNSRIQSGMKMGSEILGNKYLKDMINQVKDTIKTTNYYSNNLNTETYTEKRSGYTSTYNPQTLGQSGEFDYAYPNNIQSSNSTKNKILISSPGSTYLKFNPNSVSSTKYSKQFKIDAKEFEINCYPKDKKKNLTLTNNYFRETDKNKLRMSTSGENQITRKSNDIFKKKTPKSPKNVTKIKANGVYIVEECPSFKSSDRSLHLNFLKNKQEALNYIKKEIDVLSKHIDSKNYLETLEQEEHFLKGQMRNEAIASLENIPSFEKLPEVIEHLKSYGEKNKEELLNKKLMDSLENVHYYYELENLIKKLTKNDSKNSFFESDILEKELNPESIKNQTQYVNIKNELITGLKKLKTSKENLKKNKSSEFENILSSFKSKFSRRQAFENARRASTPKVSLINRYKAQVCEIKNDLIYQERNSIKLDDFENQIKKQILSQIEDMLIDFDNVFSKKTSFSYQMGKAKIDEMNKIMESLSSIKDQNGLQEYIQTLKSMELKPPNKQFQLSFEMKNTNQTETHNVSELSLVSMTNKNNAQKQDMIIENFDKHNQENNKLTEKTTPRDLSEFPDERSEIQKVTDRENANNDSQFDSICQERSKSGVETDRSKLLNANEKNLLNKNLSEVKEVDFESSMNFKEKNKNNLQILNEINQSKTDLTNSDMHNIDYERGSSISISNKHSQKLLFYNPYTSKNDNSFKNKICPKSKKIYMGKKKNSSRSRRSVSQNNKNLNDQLKTLDQEFGGNMNLFKNKQKPFCTYASNKIQTPLAREKKGHLLINKPRNSNNFGGDSERSKDMIIYPLRISDTEESNHYLRNYSQQNPRTLTNEKLANKRINVNSQQENSYSNKYTNIYENASVNHSRKQLHRNRNKAPFKSINRGNPREQNLQNYLPPKEFLEQKKNEIMSQLKGRNMHIGFKSNTSLHMKGTPMTRNDSQSKIQRIDKPSEMKEIFDEINVINDEMEKQKASNITNKKKSIKNYRSYNHTNQNDVKTSLEINGSQNRSRSKDIKFTEARQENKKKIVFQEPIVDNKSSFGGNFRLINNKNKHEQRSHMDLMNSNRDKKKPISILHDSRKSQNVKSQSAMDTKQNQTMNEMKKSDFYSMEKPQYSNKKESEKKRQLETLRKNQIVTSSNKTPKAIPLNKTQKSSQLKNRYEAKDDAKNMESPRTYPERNIHVPVMVTLEAKEDDYYLVDKTKEKERAKEEAREKARKEQDFLSRKQFEEKLRIETEDKIRREAEERAHRDGEANARRDVDEKARREQDSQSRKEFEERVRRETEEKIRREAHENAHNYDIEKARRDVDEKARREQDSQSRKEFEERVRKETEDKIRREVDEKAYRDDEQKAFRDADEKARREQDSQSRNEFETKMRKEAEEKSKKDAEENARKNAEFKVQQEYLEKGKRDAEEKLKHETDERAKKDAEDKLRRDAEEKNRSESIEKAKRENDEQRRLELEQQQREKEEANATKKQLLEEQEILRQEKLQKELELKELEKRAITDRENAVRDAEEKIRREYEEKMRKEAEGQAKNEHKNNNDYEEKIKREADQKAKYEADEKLRREQQNKENQEALEKAKRETEEKIRLEYAEKSKLEAQQKIASETDGNRKLELEQQLKEKEESEARQKKLLEEQEILREEKLQKEVELRELEKQSKIEKEIAIKEAQENIRKEYEEKMRIESVEKAKKEAEEKTRKQEEEKAKIEADEKAKQEADEKAKKEAENKATQDAEETRRHDLKRQQTLKEEADIKQIQQLEEQERLRQEKLQKELELKDLEKRSFIEKENAIKEAEDKMRREFEEKMRKEAEEKSKKDAEENARKNAEFKVQQEYLEKGKRDAEEKLKHETDERAKKDAEDKLRRDAEEKNRSESIEKAKRENDEQRRLELEQQQREKEEANATKKQLLEEQEILRQEKLQKELELKELEKRAITDRENAVRDAEEKIRREYEEKMRKEAEGQAKNEHKNNNDYEEKIKREADQKAKYEADEKLRREQQNKENQEALEKAKRETEEKIRLEYAEKSKLEAQQKIASETDGNRKLELEQQLKEKEESEARQKKLLEEQEILREEKLQKEVELRELEKQSKIEKEIAIKEAQENIRKEYEEKMRIESVEKAKKEAEEQTRKQEEEKAKIEADEKSKQEANEKAKKEAEEKAKKEEEEKALKLAEEIAQKEAFEKARKDAEETIRKEFEEKQKLEVNERAKKDAEEKAKKDEEEKKKKEAEEIEKKESEEKLRQEYEEKAKKADEEMKTLKQENIEKTQLLSNPNPNNEANDNAVQDLIKKLEDEKKQMQESNIVERELFEQQIRESLKNEMAENERKQSEVNKQLLLKQQQESEKNKSDFEQQAKKQEDEKVQLQQQADEKERARLEAAEIALKNEQEIEQLKSKINEKEQLRRQLSEQAKNEAKENEQLRNQSQIIEQNRIDLELKVKKDAKEKEKLKRKVEDLDQIRTQQLEEQKKILRIMEKERMQAQKEAEELERMRLAQMNRSGKRSPLRQGTDDASEEDEEESSQRAQNAYPIKIEENNNTEGLSRHVSGKISKTSELMKSKKSNRYIQKSRRDMYDDDNSKVPTEHRVTVDFGSDSDTYSEEASNSNDSDVQHEDDKYSDTSGMDKQVKFLDTINQELKMQTQRLVDANEDGNRPKSLRKIMAKNMGNRSRGSVLENYSADERKIWVKAISKLGDQEKRQDEVNKIKKMNYPKKKEDDGD